jgi:23S rRNA (adenine2503-C2)-methyltransferase
MKSTKESFFSIKIEEVKDWLKNEGASSFTFDQILNLVFLKHETNIERWTNLKKDLREKLKSSFDWHVPHVFNKVESQDGSVKFLIKLFDGSLVESVLMPRGSRFTLCISGQVGCMRACRFCQTGKMGLIRNLSFFEILFQVSLANKYINENISKEKSVTHVVYMGMGEPLDNFDEVLPSTEVLLSKKYFALSKNKVTVSTAGIVPKIKELGQKSPVSLAISLHSARDEVRTKLMPINRLYPLSDLKQTLEAYPVQTRHGITIEYIMIKGINDSLEDARSLIKFVSKLKVKVNLIPMNSHPGSVYEASTDEDIQAFQSLLKSKAIITTVRYSKAQDISGACGQLALKKQGEAHLKPRETLKQRQKELS